MKMENKDKLKETNIKNRPCFYFDDIMSVMDIDFNNILSEKNHITKFWKYFSVVHFIQNFYG